MPHATSLGNPQDAEDDALIQEALDPQSTLDFDRDLDPGEKAVDAVDFGDLSDDDLADDDQGTSSAVVDGFQSSDIPLHAVQRGHSASPHSRPSGDDFDDLFGDESPPPKKRDEGENCAAQAAEASIIPHVVGNLVHRDFDEPLRAKTQDSQFSKEQQLQQELFALSQPALNAAERLPEPPANGEELLAALWPRFERDATPRFMDLLPPKKAKFVGKEIPKPPRPLNPTKLNLEIAPDQERAFRLTSAGSKRIREDVDKLGEVSISLNKLTDISSDGESCGDSDSENDEIHGVSWQDLQMLCEDWDLASITELDETPNWSNETRTKKLCNMPDGINGDGGLDPDLTYAAAKRRKIGYAVQYVLHQQPVTLNSLHNHELATAHLARKVKVDLNDLNLLLDEFNVSSEAGPSTLNDFPKNNSGRQLTQRSANQRYNISNDDAYDLLKENHQHKIRGTLGNLHVPHSSPALRLQWPFYKTRLEKQEARSFHRPPLRVPRHEPISFDKPNFVKRKTIRGKDPHTLFAQTSDLALGDNSNMLLLEYSEEYPTMLSNLGMGNKIVNHYRKHNSEDTAEKPGKREIGESNILLPQDKSPFSLFGQVDPGETIPAIHNAMYRAPIFKQAPKDTDFLVIRKHTGVNGSSWLLRNIENLHVVGQEFPAVDVPGPHSRKVTTASKNRLKMISYRMARRNKSHRISVSEVTKHFTDTTDMQNRQKMKEFMQFDKDHKEWKMRPGEQIPDENVVRTMVKPEDVCLLESMQVGQQHLQDAGFSKDDDDQSEGDDAKEGENVEQQLAPWCTSRNFLNAAQGKAMLQLHGEGDPSGRGEAFSFMKTSMKGGFRAIGESIAERIDNKKMKDSGGHSYNVARQQQAYEESIHRIWSSQKQSLSSALEQSDPDFEEDELDVPSDAYAGTATPRSEGRASKRRRDEETASQSTRWSNNSQSGKILEITRTVRDRFGTEEVKKDVVSNPRIIRQYLRRRRAQEAADVDVLEIQPGADDEQNKRYEQRLKKELARLQRNKDRRIARDKQKGIHTDGSAELDDSPAPPGVAVPAKVTTTGRKCANCGQVGHIKTNKKLCPHLNGTMKPEEGYSTSAFTTGAPAL